MSTCNVIRICRSRSSLHCAGRVYICTSDKNDIHRSSSLVRSSFRHIAKGEIYMYTCTALNTCSRGMLILLLAHMYHWYRRSHWLRVSLGPYRWTPGGVTSKLISGPEAAQISESSRSQVADARRPDYSTPPRGDGDGDGDVGAWHWQDGKEGKQGTSFLLAACLDHPRPHPEHLPSQQITRNRDGGQI